MTTSKWEYLVINVSYREGSKNVIKYVSSNYHRVLSNILKDEFYRYLEEVGKDGWTLENIHSDEDGHETYYFKRLTE